MNKFSCFLSLNLLFSVLSSNSTSPTFLFSSISNLYFSLNPLIFPYYFSIFLDLVFQTLGLSVGMPGFSLHLARALIRWTISLFPSNFFFVSQISMISRYLKLPPKLNPHNRISDMPNRKEINNFAVRLNLMIFEYIFIR